MAIYHVSVLEIVPPNYFINNLCSILEKTLCFLAFEPRESGGVYEVPKKQLCQYTDCSFLRGYLASRASQSLLWCREENEAADKKQTHAMMDWNLENRKVFAYSWIDIDGHSEAKFSDKAIISLLGFCHYFAFSFTENIMNFLQKL